eukprot:gene52948-biopygen43557
MFARLDANKDGRISSDEAKAMEPAATAADSARGGGLMRLDVNKDGAVVREELAASSQRRFV